MYPTLATIVADGAAAKSQGRAANAGRSPTETLASPRANAARPFR
jgi:hypothetical protein